MSNAYLEILEGQYLIVVQIGIGGKKAPKTGKDR